MKRTPVLLSMVFLAALLGLLGGCAGGGGGGGAGPRVVETDAIVAALEGFTSSARQGDQAAAERFFSSRLRQSGSEAVLGTVPIWDFGKDLYAAGDDASITFTILANGIYQPSDTYAEVLAYYLSPAGARFDVIFSLVKEEGVWYIDDVRLQTQTTGAVPLAAYFPLHAGDRWKFAEFREGRLMPYYVIHTVEATPETLDGRAVYRVTETFEPRPGIIATPPADGLQGRFTPFGGTWRFSNEGGLWDYGTPSGGAYRLNSGLPLQLASPTSYVGSATMIATTVAELFQGTTYFSQVQAFLVELPDVRTTFGTFPALSLNFSYLYKFNTAPRGPSQVARKWLLKDGLGLLSYTETDAMTAAEYLRHELVEARVAGQGFNPADLPFRILSASPLPDAVPGVPYEMVLDARWGVAPLTWSLAAGSLPAGLELTPGGVLRGTPTVAGPFSFTLKVVDDRSRQDTKSYSLTVGGGLQLPDEGLLPKARVGQPYSFTFGVTGGTAPFTWEIISQSLRPAGLTLGEAAGTLSGTPSVAGTYLLQVQVKETASGRRAYKTFELRVLPEISGSMQISRARILDDPGNGDTTVTVEFEDSWKQPILPGVDTLATGAFTLIDYLDPKAGGPGTRIEAHPSTVTFDGAVTRLTFASGTVDRRSTTRYLSATGLLSADLTRAVATAPVPLGNQFLFKSFIPWSAFAGAGLPATAPKKIVGGQVVDGFDLVMLYPQGPVSTKVFAGASDRPADWQVATASVHGWFKDPAMFPPGAEYKAFFPGLFQTTLKRALFALSTIGGVDLFDLEVEDGAFVRIPIDFLAGLKFLAFRFKDRYIDANGVEYNIFIVANDNTVYTLAESVELGWTVRSSFEATITDLEVLGGEPDEFNREITIIDDQGRIRQFALDPQRRLAGGDLVDQVPGISGGGHDFRLRWNGGQTGFRILEPAGNRIFQLDRGGITWTMGGDPTTTGIKGRFNGPFSLVDYPEATGHQSWFIVADRDGLQIFENY